MKKGNILIIIGKVFITSLFYLSVYVLVSDFLGLYNHLIAIPFICYLILNIILTLKNIKIILIVINITDILLILLSLFLISFVVISMFKAQGESAIGIYLILSPIVGVFYGLLSLAINNVSFIENHMKHLP